MRWKGALLAVAAGTLLTVGAGAAQAHDRCYDRIRKEEVKLFREIRRHGPYSRQAYHRRARIERLQFDCARRARYARYDRGRGTRGVVVFSFGSGHRHNRYCRH